MVDNPFASLVPQKTSKPNPFADLVPAKKTNAFLDLVPSKPQPPKEDDFYQRVGKAELAGAKQVGEGLENLIPKDIGNYNGTDTVKAVLGIGGGLGRILASPIEAAAKPVAKMLGAKNPDAAAEAASNLAQDVVGGASAVKGLRSVMAPERIVSAAVKDETGIPIPGKNHDEAYAKMEGVPPLTRPISTDKVSDDLFKLSNSVKADRIEMRDKLKTIEGVPAQTWEKLYAYEENPKGVALTPEESKLYNDQIAPMAKEAAEHVAYLKNKGYEVGEDIDTAGYTPRMVKGKSPVDALTGGKQPVGRKSLSKEATSTRARSMFAAEDAAGKRQVVYVDNGNVYTAKGKNFLGTIGDDAKNVGSGTPIEGTKLKLQQAKTPEIEAATDIEYHKNLLANRVTNTLQLRRARRNAEFLEEVKKDPNIENFAHAPGNKNQVPNDWREIANIPQFRGYRFKPEYAEVFEDFVKNARSPEELAGALEKVGRLAKASLFYNPLPHAFNVANHYFVSKGLLGTVKDLPATFRSAGKAARAVMSQDKIYQSYLRDGASLPGADRAAVQMQKELVRAMGEDMKRDPKKFAELATAFGYANPVNWIKGVYNASSKALWSFSDMVSLTRIMELESQGLSRAEAIAEAEKGIPNYRIPSRVGGTGELSRTASQVLQNPALSMFGRYQYGRMRAYADTVKKFTSKKGFTQGADQLAMMGVLLTAYYPLLDKAVQSLTGNEEASMGASGAMALIKAWQDVADGKKTPGQALLSTFSPGMISALAELLANSRLGTGQNIYQPGDVTAAMKGDLSGLAHVGYDVGKFGLEQFAPVSQAIQLAQGKITPREFALMQVGIKDPTDKQVSDKRYGQKIRNKQKLKAEAQRGF